MGEELLSRAKSLISTCVLTCRTRRFLNVVLLDVESACLELDIASSDMIDNWKLLSADLLLCCPESYLLLVTLVGVLPVSWLVVSIPSACETEIQSFVHTFQNVFLLLDLKTEGMSSLGCCGGHRVSIHG